MNVASHLTSKTGAMFVLSWIVSILAAGQTVTAVSNGPWQSPSTWSTSQVPTSTDEVVVPAGVDVALEGTVRAQSIAIQGMLRAASNVSFDLETESITVNGAGALFGVGTRQSPIDPNQSCTVTLLGNDPTQPVKHIMAMNGGAIELHGAPKVSWAKLASTVPAGSNVIVVAEPVDWEAGDAVVVVSSHLNWGEAEERIVSSVSADGLTVTLQSGLMFEHVGAEETYTRGTDGKTWVADLRAEVGLLTRNVKVQGDATSEANGFGGHIMAMENSTLRGSNVELYRMGQKSQLGKYPWHWHMIHEDGQGQYLTDASIHRSYNRALTIHGTSNVVVQNNFMYDHIGHGLFLEDGTERFNVIKNNVVALSKRPAVGEEVTPSDNQFNEVQNRTPSSFWITNPNNTIEGNVAAGTEGTGFWFAFPQAPMGASSTDPRYNGIVPFQEPLGSFSGNKAHSCMSGFDVFDQLFPDHSIRKNAGWQNADLHLIEGCTWYANNLALYSGIGGAVGDKLTYTTNLIFQDNVLVDNVTAIMLASYSQVVESAIASRSNNGILPGLASLYRTYDGAGQVRDCHLVGWNLPNVDYVSDGGAATKHTNHRISGITTDDGQPPRVDLRDYDIPVSNTDLTPQSLSHPRVWNKVLLDEDGSFAGVPNSSIVSNHPWMLVGDEEQPSNWTRAYRSPHRFALALLEFPGTLAADIPNVTCTRTRLGTPTESVFYVYGWKEHIQLPVIVSEGFEYTYQFEELPSTNAMEIVLDDATVGDACLLRFRDFGKLDGLQIFSSDLSLPALDSYVDVAQGNASGYYVEPDGDVYVKLVASQFMQTVDVSWIAGIALPPLDTDGDGVSDESEIINGTDPFSPNTGPTGCTYAEACNYDAAAVQDDGSCTYPPLGCDWPNNASVGCTYSSAQNFSTSAVYDDGSCTWGNATLPCPSDIDGSGQVTVVDLLIFLPAFGNPCALSPG